MSSHVLEIRTFRPEYIHDAAQLFVATHEDRRARVPLIPRREGILDEVARALSESVERPGVAAFRGGALVGYMVETQTAPDWMSKKTAFCIRLYSLCVTKEDTQQICQRMYAQLSGAWIANGYHTHEVSLFADDEALSFTFFRLGFGMTHFQLLRGLDEPEGEPASVTIRKVESEETIQELNGEHHRYYRTPPLFWWLSEQRERPETDRVRSGEIEVFAAFDGGDPVAFISVRKGGAEAWVLDDEKNGRIAGAYAREEYRGRGIGTALLRKVVGWAHEQGLARLYVEGESANIWGGNFWMKHFTPVVYSVRRCVDERITAKP